MDRKSSLMILLAAVSLFVISAGASYVWRYFQDEAPVAEGTPSGLSSESAESSATTETSPLEESEPESKSDVPVALRPPYVEGSEEIAKLAEDRRSGLADVAEQKKQLEAERKRMNLIYKDILDEQAKVDEMRKKLSAEVDEQVKAVERYLTQMQVDGEHGADLPDIGTSSAEGEGDLATSAIDAKRRLKKMGTEYDTMSPESVAAIFRQLVKGGNIDTVVGLLDVMKERQVGNVMEVFRESDPGLAAELNMRRLPASQQPAAPATTNP
jgi:hypothetical protein